jgi:hypothetical protein
MTSGQKEKSGITGFAKRMGCLGCSLIRTHRAAEDTRPVIFIALLVGM